MRKAKTLVAFVPLITGFAVLVGLANPAMAEITVFYDRDAFLAATGATAEPAWDLFVPPGDPIVTVPAGTPVEWGNLTYWLNEDGWAGAQMHFFSWGSTVTGIESYDVDIDFPVTVIGWEYYEPDGWDEVRLELGGASVGSIVPDPHQPFYGFVSTVPFDRIELDDTAIWDDYLGQAYLVPEPASLALLALGALLAARRR